MTNDHPRPDDAAPTGGDEWVAPTLEYLGTVAELTQALMSGTNLDAQDFLRSL
jgi:hypothetical protein